MQRVKEYLDEIKVPYTEENADGMTVLKLKYNEDLLAIFPPDEGADEFHAVTAYDGKVQQYGKMALDDLKKWLYAVFIEQSPDYVYVDEAPTENN
jgi:hypothetical protein